MIVVETARQLGHGRRANSEATVAVTDSRFEIALINPAAISEWPPRSKKLSSMPTRSMPRASANNWHSTSSRAVRGPRSDTCRDRCGTGSEDWSSLPFGRVGNSSTAMNAAGIM